MAAGVEEAAHLALLVAHEDDGATGHLAGHEVAGLLHLGGVADINPALAEDLAHFLAQDLLGDMHGAVEKEDALLPVVDHVGAIGWHGRNLENRGERGVMNSFATRECQFAPTLA
jgi:hypothetical protein